MTEKAYLTQELLLKENATHSLEIEYNYDMEQIFVQLRDKANGECTVLDADSIFEQAYDVLTKKHDDITTQYVLRMADGETFTGKPEDIARWYCKHSNIRLYIEPDFDGKENSFILFAAFPDSDTFTHIAYLESDYDIETGYGLFFSEYMLECDNPDYELREIS